MLAEQRANNLRHLRRTGKYAFLRVLDYGLSMFCSLLMLFSYNTVLSDLKPLVLLVLSFVSYIVVVFFSVILKSKHGGGFLFCFKLYFGGRETHYDVCINVVTGNPEATLNGFNDSFGCSRGYKY